MATTSRCAALTPRSPRLSATCSSRAVPPFRRGPARGGWHLPAYLEAAGDGVSRNSACGADHAGARPGRGADHNRGPRGAASGPLAPGQRWSVSRKREAVLRLLRGEVAEDLSRELGVPLYKLERWRQRAEAALDGALKERETDAVSGELATAMQRIGELSMENELLRSRIERPGPLVRRRSRGIARCETRRRGRALCVGQRPTELPGSQSGIWNPRRGT